MLGVRQADIFLGNSGTSTRSLTAALAVLSTLSPQDLANAIALQNWAAVEQAPGVGLGWFLGDEGIINHGGSSGTNAWADLKTGVVGIVFFQLHGAARDKTSSLHRRFREEVRKAYPSDR